MTARALLREAVAGAAPGGPGVVVQIDHWAMLPATMTIEQTAVELSCGVGRVKGLIKAGKLRRIVDVPGFLVATSSVRQLVEG